MHRVLPAFCSAVLFGAIAFVAALTLTKPAEADMALYEGKNRPLIIFTPYKRYPAFMRQLRLLGGRGARIRERDMVVVLVVGDRVSSQYGPKPATTASELRKTYGVAEDAFSMFLVDKDTTVKHSFDGPITAEILFVEIDAFPSRQEELQN